MGRSVSLFVVRGASILAAGMLLFAVFSHAHAENLDGYGLKPLDAADPAAPGAVAPAPSGYTPAGAGNVPQSGYVPAPAGPVQIAAAPTQPVAVAPLQQAAAPAQATPVYQPPSQPAAYGYRNGDGAPPDASMSGYPGAYPATSMATPMANGYYQTLNYSPAAQAAMGRANPDYVLGPGDKVKLTVYNETDLSGDFTIDGSGFLRLPLIGQLRAAGYTSPQLEAAIGGAYAQGYLKSPRVSLEVTAYRPFYIIGAVNRPGEYAYVNHMTALNAVALAGGYPEQCRGKRRVHPARRHQQGRRAADRSHHARFIPAM